MGKRANPFVEDFIPQSKVHVGLKQFNNNNDRLQEVYEKTLDLLFRGAKTILATDATNGSDIACTKKDNMKQLFIGKDGALLHSGSLVCSKSKVRQCSCGYAMESQCAYCDAVLCGSCLHGCTRCEKAYCTHCMLIRSEGSEVCVSCCG